MISVHLILIPVDCGGFRLIAVFRQTDANMANLSVAMALPRTPLEESRGSLPPVQEPHPTRPINHVLYLSRHVLVIPSHSVGKNTVVFSKGLYTTCTNMYSSWF